MTNNDAETPVRYELDDSGVALITLNRPETLNAITPAMKIRFGEVVTEADRDPRARVIVLTGAGRGFCSGADLKVLDRITEGAHKPARNADMGILLRISTPVIAAVNGPVAGVGFSMMMMADLRFASDVATMSTMFARLGLIAEYGVAPLLQRAVGYANAADLLFSGRTFDAAEALRLGVVQRVYSARDLLPETLAYAREVARNCSPYSMAMIKRQITDPGLIQEYEDSVVMIGQAFERNDVVEALAARAENRTPSFPPYLQ